MKIAHSRHRAGTSQPREGVKACLDAVVESSAEAIFGSDPEGRITFWNSAAERILGYRAEEIRGQSTEVLVPAELRARERDVVHRIENGERIEARPTQRQRKDGSCITVSVNQSPVKNRHGKIIGTVSTLHEIDGPKNLDFGCIGREVQLESVLQAMSDAVVLIDMKGEAVFMNEAHARLRGFTSVKEMKKGWAQQAYDLFDMDGRAIPPNQRPTARVLRGESPFSEQYWVCRRDNGRQWLATISGAPVRDANGNQIMGIMVARDVTESWASEQDALRRRAEFESVLRAITDPLLILDMSGKLVLVNEPFARLHGFASVEDAKAGYAQFVQQLDATDMAGQRISIEEAPSARVLRGDCVHEQKMWVMRRDTGKKWLLNISGAPVRDHTGKQILAVIIVRDITEPWKMEQALAEAREQLARRADDLENAVNKRTAQLQTTVAELEAVSYSLSHDMRAPLRTIHSFCELILEKAGQPLGEQEQDLLRKMIRAAGRLDRLIQDVLTYTRVARGDISLSRIETEPLLRQLIQERPEFQPPRADIRIDGPLHAVRGHDAFLTQCITNLLDNAVKFVAPGVQPQVRIWNEITQKHVRLWFEDNGIGIPSHAQERIFGMFQRLSDETTYPGTGIGLTIVRKAVERMHGTVGVESEPGRGSRFWVQLRRG